MTKISIFVSKFIQMKRIIGLMALVLMLNACDDGDLTVETISFEDVTAQKCSLNNVIYKIKGNEALFLEIPESYFVNDPTLPNTPRQLTISSSNKVIYRSYNGSVATDNVCATIPATTPVAVEEWTATSGIIQITTTPIVVANTTLTSGNATKITGYNHYIVLKNVTFSKPTGIQLYETFVFGYYKTNASNLPFAFDDLVDKCTSSNLVYNFSGSECLLLNIDPSFFPAAVGTQSGLISATNKVTYKLFTSGLNDGYFCADPTPTTPVLAEEWNAVDGVTGVSGIIEVSTTTFGTGFQHTIHLKKVTFKKGNSTFYLGDDYLYGSFIN